MKKIVYTFLCMLTGLSVLQAQQTPAAKQTKSILITNATAHIGDGKVIENSFIGFKDGKLTLVVDATISRIDMTQFDEVIEASGKHVYPGFIVVNSTLGLVEIDAVKASDDEREIGQMNPNIRSLIAYNTESKVIETMRPNGVLAGQIVPQGGTIAGTSSVVQFDAWNWEDAAIKTDDAIHINWPNSLSRGRWWMGEPNTIKKNEKYAENIETLKTYFAEAKAYNQGKGSERNLPLEAMKGVFDSSQKLFIHADGQREIVDAITFAEAMGIKDIIIVGGAEATPVANFLVEHNVPVVVTRPHSLPSMEDIDVKGPYKLAADLHAKGVKVTIDPAGDMERMSSRNLPFYAGTAAVYGIDKEEAISLITKNPAEILGIDDIMGTLESGKDATLFISEGDALDMRTNIISKAFIQGRDISLETHQTELYHRYNEKINGQP
ncbi:Imidazolonepropionase [Pustulibacterium marinum]|uniref:Imidazolonepropionase n=1 Tax=Pustulibacterium marinum TaxID=1224947 RepID=A0A1I7G5R3_9FLAO|nr:amidohydrolase family protein [Pustulibacterium marinum]SFU43576.1 Imidazolonepropionase [Pustulibacterium marinum]